MSDIFGRVAAILLAAAMLFGIPVVYMNERAKTARQMYLLSETVHFVDAASNLGYISAEMLDAYYEAVYAAGLHCEVRMLHETTEYALDEESGRYQQVSTYYDETDIRAAQPYLLYRGDYLRVTVAAQDAILTLPMLRDDTISVTYGGTIKYEDF